MEQVNQELETYLRLFASNKPEEWSKFLPMVEFTHNSATHSVTQWTPFSLMMGYEPQAYPPLAKPSYQIWKTASPTYPPLVMMLKLPIN